MGLSPILAMILLLVINGCFCLNFDSEPIGAPGSGQLSRAELEECHRLNELVNEYDIDDEFLSWFLDTFFTPSQLDGPGIVEWEFSVANYGLLSGMLDYASEKFQFSTDLNVVTRNRLCSNTAFHAFLKETVPTSISQHVMETIRAVQIDANL